MRLTESLAKSCFDSVRAPDRLRPVRSQAHGEPDFEIVDPDGECIGVLEVTSTVDPTYQATLEALHPDRGGSRVRAVACTRSWIVWPAPNARVRRLRMRLDGCLASLEQAGVTQFDQDSVHPAVRTVLDELMLVSGRVVDDCPGWHSINLPGLSAHVDVGDVNAVVMTAAAKPDNLRKLSNSDVRERHLFVYVDFSTLSAHYVLESEYMPDAVSVDPSITHLWAARHLNAYSAFVLHARNGAPWTRQTVSWTPSSVE